MKKVLLSVLLLSVISLLPVANVHAQDLTPAKQAELIKSLQAAIKNIIAQLTIALQNQKTASTCPPGFTCAPIITTQTNVATTTPQSKIQALQQQILDIKKKYYQEKAGVQQMPISLGDKNGEINKLTSDTNTKISQLQLQIQELQLNGGESVNASILAPLPSTTSQTTHCSFGFINDGAGVMDCN